MPHKRPDLKKRLNELRDEPEPQIEIELQVDAELMRRLKVLARRKRVPVETYITNLLATHVEITGEKGTL